jgi:hypothetical protein
VVGVGVLALALAVHRGTQVPAGAPSPESALAAVLSNLGLACDAADVTWVGGRGGVLGSVLGGGRALVRASAQGEPSELYLVEVRRSPEGKLLGVGDSWDLTNTSGVDESRPAVDGTRAAYATSADGLYTGVHVLDLAGRTASKSADFTRQQRAQAALTNLQQTGQTRGVAHDTFALDPVARDVSLAWRKDGALEVHADGHLVVVDPARTRVIEGEAYVRVVADEQARPGNLVTWAVDRVRALPWVGDDRMQWIKAVAFTVLDKAHVAFSSGTTAEEVKDELGLTAQTSLAPPTFVDPEIGWPPAPIKTPITSPLPGEGRWIALDNDRFITRTTSGATPAIVTSFVRPSPLRPDARVYVTLWDPRQLALHMEAGTIEPISANGEHGPGVVPRSPQVMKRLVAAFNGGFQAQHGEYGMISNGIEYLPPKPYAATVVELRDGSNGFGAWPSTSNVPDDVVALRQNLTALVQDGKFNPWGRVWWGGTPPGWPDQIHSARSAVCMTTEGFAGYFYSTSISAEDLAAGMLATRCAFGIHLDMNPGHAGFEFYDVAADGQLPPLGRTLQADWEAEGKVSGMPGYAFRARRMIRGMGHMLFPRYIQREARDFFYLTTRPLLPGPPIGGEDAAADASGQWRTKGLPQHGFPYALAIATAASSDADGGSRPRGDVLLRVVRADPRTMQPGAADSGPVVLALSGPARGSRTLYWARGALGIADTLPASGATLLVRGYLASEAPAATARAAVGVQDDDGMLAWVELPPETKPDASTAAALDGLLARLGCSVRMVVPGDARALLGGTLDAAGEPAGTPALDAVHLVRARAPDAHAIFQDTPIVPAQVWQPLQAKRVRYFYKPASSAQPAASAAP